jgi:hypothetical protein
MQTAGFEAKETLMLSRLMIVGVCVLAVLSGVRVSAGLDEAAATTPGVDQVKPIGGDNCRDVKITVRNQQTLRIRVDRLFYRDYDVDKWRTEATWDGLFVESQTTKSRIRNLEHVRNDETKLLVRYRKYRPDAGWTGLYSTQTSKFTCTDEMNVLVVVD